MSDKLFKLFLVFVAAYMMLHIGAAMADTILINQSNGQQSICMIVGNIVQCY